MKSKAYSEDRNEDEFLGKYAQLAEHKTTQGSAHDVNAKQKPSVDQLLPVEKERLKAKGEIKYKDEIEEKQFQISERKQDRITFRISREKKEILEAWLRAEKEQHLAAGVRDIIIEFMKENNLV